MSTTLKHNTYSTNIKTQYNYSYTLFNQNINILTQYFTQTNHLNSIIQIIPLTIHNYKHKNLNPNNTIIINNPYLNKVHLNNIFIISPIYFKNKIQKYISNLTHHINMGNKTPTNIKTFNKIFQKNIIIPPIKLTINNKINQNIFQLILNQIQSKHKTTKNFRTQITTNNTKTKHFTHLLKQYKINTISNYTNHLIKYTNQLTQNKINKLPHNKYTTKKIINNDNFTKNPIKLTIHITINNNKILFNFTNYNPKQPTPINSTYSITYTTATYILHYIIDVNIPINTNFYKSVKLITPKKTITHYTPPSPIINK